MVKTIRKCNCQKEFDSELGFRNHLGRNPTHQEERASSGSMLMKVSDKPTEPLAEVIDERAKILKLKQQDVSDATLEKTLSKLKKEESKGIDTSELVELKKLELLTQKQQPDGFSSVLPLLLQQNQQSFLIQQENSNKMFQLLMSQQDKQTQMMLESFKLQTQIQNNGFRDIGALAQTISGVKELAGQLGWAEDKTQTFIQSTISQALDKLSPTLQQLVGVWAEKIKSRGHSTFQPTNVEAISEENNVSEPTENQSHHFHQGTYISEPSLKEILTRELKDDYSDLIFLGDNKSEPKRVVKSADEELREKFGV